MSIHFFLPPKMQSQSTKHDNIQPSATVSQWASRCSPLLCVGGILCQTSSPPPLHKLASQPQRHLSKSSWAYHPPPSDEVSSLGCGPPRGVGLDPCAGINKKCGSRFSGVWFWNYTLSNNWSGTGTHHELFKLLFTSGYHLIDSLIIGHFVLLLQTNETQ